MNPAQVLSSLQRASRVNPAARRATIWQVAKSPEGAKLFGPGDEYLWRKTCAAWVIFTYQKADGYEGRLIGLNKVSVLPDPVSLHPFQMPDLSESAIIWRNPRMLGDPFPELTITTDKIGGDAMGLSQQYTVRVPDFGEHGPIFIGPLPMT